MTMGLKDCLLAIHFFHSLHCLPADVLTDVWCENKASPPYVKARITLFRSGHSNFPACECACTLAKEHMITTKTYLLGTVRSNATSCNNSFLLIFRHRSTFGTGQSVKYLKHYASAKHFNENLCSLGRRKGRERQEERGSEELGGHMKASCMHNL